MTPLKPVEIALKRIKDIQILIAQTQLVRRGESPEEMSIKTGCELRVGEDRCTGFNILRADRAIRAALHISAELVGKGDHSLVQQVARRTEVAAGEGGNRLSGLQISVMVKAGVIHAITKTDVRFIAANGPANPGFHRVAAVGIEVLPGVDTIRVIQ